MTNDELKKKIAQIIADYFCPQRNEHKSLFGDDRLCYSKMNFAECERVAECTDALIAAGLTFDKTTAILAERTNSKTLIHKAQCYDEMKHRAEVAEREFSKLVHEMYEHGIRPMCDEKFFVESRLKDDEKELAEENSGKKEI